MTYERVLEILTSMGVRGLVVLEFASYRAGGWFMGGALAAFMVVILSPVMLLFGVPAVYIWHRLGVFIKQYGKQEIFDEVLTGILDGGKPLTDVRTEIEALSSPIPAAMKTEMIRSLDFYVYSRDIK